MEHEENPAGQAEPVRLTPEDLAPETLRAVVESFVLREGTDYGLEECSLDDKVAQVLAQVRRGDAHIVFDPPTESVSIVVTSALEPRHRPRPTHSGRTQHV